ncbi:CpaF family protein [Actinospongicola halichondriae]|uniref:CpaF family protein n=1 Tax=Actinospongicola halichondriae TaxID=3236844 RepID=UPI003D44CEAB
MNEGASDETCLDDRVHREVIDGDVGSGRGAIGAVVRAHAPLVDEATVAAVTRRVQARMHGLGLLDDVLADEAVTDVMVNGPGPVWVETRGVVHATDVALDAAAVHQLVERVVTPLGLRADRRSPLVDARLADGSRVHIAMPPLAVDGPYVTVRRFAARTLPLTDFAGEDVARHLVAAVRERRSIVVSGGTGAGKTTLLNALCQHLTDGERVVTVEDAAELRIPGRHVVRLESRPASADGLDAVTIRELVRNALRMRPDRLIVGEVRGGEALDMIQAMNTGHDGSLSTCHANGPDHALRRLETMVLTAGVDLPLVAVRDQLVGAIDLLVHVVRGSDGDRRIDAVHRVADDPAAHPRSVPLVTGDALVDDRW